MLKPADLVLYRRLRKYGIVNPLYCMLEARRANRLAGNPVEHPVALAAAVLDQESGGGANVFGHDPTIWVGAGAVTKRKYLAYKRDRQRSGNRLMQGVGPLQLTWYSYQDKADSYGGCWNPRYNMRVGFEKLFNGVRRYGLRSGIRAYNGSGPAAERYADTVLNRFSLWQRRLR